MTTSKEERDEARKALVGYKNPPVETRFKKGVSGNPSGRPRKRKSPTDEIQQVLSRTVTMRENGRVKKVPLTTALATQLVQAALAGDRHARKEVFEMLWRTEPEEIPAEPSPDYTDAQRQRVVDLMDLYDIRDGLVVLGLMSIDADGRTKISPKVLEKLAGRSFRNDQRGEIVQLVKYYLEGTESP